MTRKIGDADEDDVVVGQDPVVELAHDLDGERLWLGATHDDQPTPVSPTLTSAYGIVSGHSPGSGGCAAVAGAVIGQSAAVMIAQRREDASDGHANPSPRKDPMASRVTRSRGRPAASMMGRRRVPSSGRSGPARSDSLIRYRATTVSSTSTPSPGPSGGRTQPSRCSIGV